MMKIRWSYGILGHRGGLTIYGNVQTIIESNNSGFWDDTGNETIKEILVKNEFLLTREQYELEELLVKNMRDMIVFDDTFMSLTIIPTDTCNFNCLYCYQSDTFHNMTKETANSIIKFIKKRRTLKKLHISWFGGEPLCNKKMVFYLMEEINKVCTENRIILISDMTTNGSLLDIETFKKLYSLKVLNYQITIDGCEETHNIQRPTKIEENSYKIIMENLINIKNHANGKLFKIGIRVNFTSLVDKNFEKFKLELISQFSGDHRFYFFFQWVKNWGGDRILEIADSKCFLKKGKLTCR